MFKEKFIEEYKRNFFSPNKYRLIFDINDNNNDFIKVNDARKKIKELSNFIFNNKEVWVRLIIWDANFSRNKNYLIKCGYNEQTLSFVLGNKNDGIYEEYYSNEALDESELYYIKYEKYDYKHFEPFITAITGFDLGVEPCAGISANFMSFENPPILLNIPDDRFFELLCDDINYLKELKSKFMVSSNKVTLYEFQRETYTEMKIQDKS